MEAFLVQDFQHQEDYAGSRAQLADLLGTSTAPA
jgi:hypothetical protein